MALNSVFYLQEPHPAGWWFLRFLEDMTMSLTLENGVSHAHVEIEAVRYLNHYRCPTCQIDWQDVWHCACNDRCSSCHKEIVPLYSESMDC